VLPAANPDFECLYGEVKRWWIELDERTRCPTRELGFDENGLPIVAAPWEGNRGVWTDSPVVLDWNDHPGVAPADFEAAWQRFAGSTKSAA